MVHQASRLVANKTPFFLPETSKIISYVCFLRIFPFLFSFFSISTHIYRALEDGQQGKGISSLLSNNHVG
jgi:hypothetical protein